MKLVLATGLWTRMAGLLRSGCCSGGETLLLAPCKSIHTFGMRSPIDVAFLDKDARVVASECGLPAGKVRSHPHAVAVLERRSVGDASWPHKGEHLGLSLLSANVFRKEGEL